MELEGERARPAPVSFTPIYMDTLANSRHFQLQTGKSLDHRRGAGRAGQGAPCEGMRRRRQRSRDSGDHSPSQTELPRGRCLTWKLLGWGILFPPHCIGFVLLANFRHGFPLKLTLFLRLALPGAGCMGYDNENTRSPPPLRPNPPRSRSKFDLTFLGCCLSSAQCVCSFK